MAPLPDGLIHSLEDVATRLRVDSIRATTAAGSGHPSSSASAADLVAAVFFDAMRFDPERPRHPSSDRFVLSKGHAAPLLYAVWAELGVLKRDDLLTLRDLASDLEGHPTPRLPFVDVATGSLGQGLGAGVGLAIGARMAGSDARVWVLLGDGEVAEGSVWEAAALAAQRGLDNVVAIVDVNALGQSGPTMLGHDLTAYQRRFAAFGWRAMTVDGHDMRAVVAALRRARAGRGAPTAVIARTLKGRGIEGVEASEGWHGKPLPAADADRAVQALESRLHHVPAPPIRARRGRARVPSEVHAPGAPEREITGEIATREAYGRALVRLGGVDRRVVVLDGDVKNSTYAERFAGAFPDRYVESFIAEQNMVSVAAGLAAQGWVPFASSFACFLTRAADQVRMAGISRSNVKLCGSHAGVSIGEDGPSQMGIEDVSLACSLPGFTVVVPADEPATHKAVEALGKLRTPAYLRAGRPNVPIVYEHGCDFQLGKAIQLRDGKDLTIIANGLMLAPALEAAATLAGQGIQARVLDMHTVKPADDAAIRAAARDTGRILVAEEHLLHGGLGSVVAMSVVRQHPAPMRFVGINDTFAESGKPEELLAKYGLTAADIVKAARELVGK